MPPHQYPQQVVYAQRPGSGLAVGALICGIFGAIIALIPILGLFGMALGLVALVLGLVGWSRARKGAASGKGMAITGTVLGVIAIGLGIIGLAIVGSAFSQLEDDLNEIDRDFQQSVNQRNR